MKFLKMFCVLLVGNTEYGVGIVKHCKLNIWDKNVEALKLVVAVL